MAPPSAPPEGTSPLWLSSCWPTKTLQPDPRRRHNFTPPYSNFTSTTNSLLFPNCIFSSSESLPRLTDSLSTFLTVFPRYRDTSLADHIRHKYYLHLSNRTCLDYSGIGLNYTDFEISSQCPQTCTETSIRNRIMKFLNLREDDYSTYFTANRSSAFKLLAEIFHFEKNQKLITVYDHESDGLFSLIDICKRRGGKAMSADFSWPTLRICSETLNKIISRKGKKKNKKKGLIVFPLQSLISGAKYSLQWMKFAEENGWYVALDTLALAPKDLDSFGLSLFKPDFIICSFYKVFGENPAGFAALLVLNSIAAAPRSTGIVNLVPSSDRVEVEEIECRGLDHVDSLGMLLIRWRLRCITNWLVNALTKLRFPHTDNGLTLVKIYGPRVKFERGPAVAFNIFDWKGERIEPALVQKLADRCNISLSCGFLCNIRFKEQHGQEKKRVSERRGVAVGVPVVSASFGFLSSFEDAYTLWEFVAKFLDADFVERERWRYTALNQKLVEI